jgi:hypothetical protein
VLIFFIFYVVFILHINFLLRNILLGHESDNFFNFVMTYNFSPEVSLISLEFVTLCMLSFYLAYTLIYRQRNKFIDQSSLYIGKNTTFITSVSAFMMASYLVYVSYKSGFNYGSITQFRAQNSFIFELRAVYLLLLSFHLLNIPISQIIKEKKYAFFRFSFIFYGIALLFFQARSAMFEVFVIFIYSYLMWNKDKIRFKYIVALCFLIFIPNILVMARMGVPDNISELIDGIFTVEYSILLNNYLGSVIFYEIHNETYSFLPQVWLIFPSWIRLFFDIEVGKIEYFTQVANLAKVSGGGFSLIAQMYSDFQWKAPLVFLVAGLLIGWLNKGAYKVGSVSLFYASAPLVYSMFILSLRNDFGVMFKYMIQIMVLAMVLSLIKRIKV